MSEEGISWALLRQGRAPGQAIQAAHRLAAVLTQRSAHRVQIAQYLSDWTARNPSRDKARRGQHRKP